MIAPIRLSLVLAVLVGVTLFAWHLAGAHPMAPSLGISAAVLFIALFKVALILIEFMEARRAPSWVKRSSAAWLVLFFAALFAVHWAVGGS
jgi:hypothetical protein